jgi:hypothetical protein
MVLFDNMLQALNRLYDQETRVVDVEALFYATGVALGGSEAGRAIARTGEALVVIRGVAGSEVARNCAALVVTQAVREMVAATTEEDAAIPSTDAVTDAAFAAALRETAALLRRTGHEEISDVCEVAALALSGDQGPRAPEACY